MVRLAFSAQGAPAAINMKRPGLLIRHPFRSNMTPLTGGALSGAVPVLRIKTGKLVDSVEHEHILTRSLLVTQESPDSRTPDGCVGA